MSGKRSAFDRQATSAQGESGPEVPSADAHVLLVDDDPALRALVRNFLSEHGYRVSEADGAHAMRQVLAGTHVDLILLDVMMPGENGLSVLKSLSARQAAPVILVSALGSETDRIVGLEVGADDYLAKPFNPRELLARIRAVLRRQRQHGGMEPAGSVFRFDGWQLDVASRILRDPDSVIVSLSDGEFSLLRAFVERPQRVLSRDQLLDHAKGRESDALDRAIDTQVSRLRRKLIRGWGGELIRTVRSEGYMFMPRVTRA